MIQKPPVCEAAKVLPSTVGPQGRRRRWSRMLTAAPIVILMTVITLFLCHQFFSA
jgi:hypothetical protein